MRRRDFMKTMAATGAVLASGITIIAVEAAAGEEEKKKEEKESSSGIPMRDMGSTGVKISCIGVGGYHLGTPDDPEIANEIVARALDAGVNFFDNAWEYHQGESEIRLGNALKGKRDKAIVMTKVCTHGRGKEVAMRMLEESLARLQTDYLDVWQIHEVIYGNDPDLIFAPGGVIEALELARKQGKVRFVGFTGHKDPSIHLRMLRQGFHFDTVQMPLNCFDATFRSFEQQVLPEAASQGVAVFGMKSLGGSGEMVTTGAILPEEGLRYAMSLPVAATVSGMDSVAVLEQNLAVARGFKPMAAEEMEALRKRCAGLAADGRYEQFKTTKRYDGDPGREQHGFPSAKELPI
jgi:aryl-alcohol dehydrogenase-like predicted oxidoreductase